jgi:hypothetical protein
LDEVLVKIDLLLEKTGVKMRMAMVGSILASAFLVFKLPVALARAPCKVAMRQGCSTSVVSARHKIADTKTWDKCHSVVKIAEIPYWVCKQTGKKKKKKKKKKIDMGWSDIN